MSEKTKDTNETPGEERRRYARAPIELRVEYTRLNAFFADYTKNISKGGTFIRTTQPLETGTEFVFQLFVPHRPEPLLLRGQVVRIVTEEDAQENPGLDPGMGIRFIYTDENKRQSIEEVAEKLMKDSLGEHAYTRLLQEK